MVNTTEQTAFSDFFSQYLITNTDSKLDDSFLLPYSTTEISISLLPPTPCARLNDSTAVTSGDEEDVSMLEEGDDMLQDDGNCWSPAQPEVDQTTLFSTHDLDNTVVLNEQSSGMCNCCLGLFIDYQNMQTLAMLLKAICLLMQLEF